MSKLDLASVPIQHCNKFKVPSLNLSKVIETKKRLMTPVTLKNGSGSAKSELDLDLVKMNVYAKFGDPRLIL
jgi:hypothetical protein